MRNPGNAVGLLRFLDAVEYLVYFTAPSLSLCGRGHGGFAVFVSVIPVALQRFFGLSAADPRPAEMIQCR